MPSFANVFAHLPDKVKDLLISDVSTDINFDIATESGIKPEQLPIFMALIRKVVLQTIQPKDLFATVKKDLGFDDVKANHLALELLGRRFLPMQWYLGNVEELITQLGGDLAKYQAEAEKNYPEVYHPELAEKTTEPEVAEESPEEPTEPTILRNIEDRLTTPKGRAEVLLRLTALSQEIEDAAKANKLSEKEGQELMHSLDALSYAVNTQDLNPLETAAIKRRLKNVIAKLKQAGS